MPSLSLTSHTLLIFYLTYFTYAALHASRSAYSYGKHAMEHDPLYPEGKIDDYFLGTVDMIFMLFYGLGLFVAGYIGDKFSLKKMLLVGGSVATFFLFLIFLIRVSNSSNTDSIIAFMCFSGLFQSVGYPACVTILGNWVDKKKKGRIFGLWSSCHNIGNIIGTLFGMFAVDSSDIGWQYSILFACLFMMLNLTLVGFFVISNPILAGFEDPNKSIHNEEIKKEIETVEDVVAEDGKIETPSDQQEINLELQEIAKKEKGEKENAIQSKKGLNLPLNSLPKPKSLNPFKVCMIPGVLFYAILNVCIKILVVSLLLWLPIYLKDQKLEHHAANIAFLFEIGQILGSFALGYFCDKINKRAALIMPVLLVNVIVFIIIANLRNKEDLVFYYFCLFLVGIFLGGPANLIAAMISQDISHNKQIKQQNKKIGSTLVGIIDGSGYIGVGIMQKLVPYFRGEFFLVMILFLCFSSIWISPKAFHEIVGPIQILNKDEKRDGKEEKKKIAVNNNQL